MQNSDYFWFGLLLWLSSTLAAFYFWGKQRQNPISEPTQPSDDSPKFAPVESESRPLHEQLQQQHRRWQDESFEQLKSLLISFPTARLMAESKPSLPAKNLTALFAPLDALLQNWGYETIGEPWAQVAFDPQLHQPDEDDLEPGEMVYIRFVGYRDRDRVLCQAKVSRTLPIS